MNSALGHPLAPTLALVVTVLLGAALAATCAVRSTHPAAALTCATLIGVGHLVTGVLPAWRRSVFRAVAYSLASRGSRRSSRIALGIALGGSVALGLTVAVTVGQAIAFVTPCALAGACSAAAWALGDISRRSRLGRAGDAEHARLRALEREQEARLAILDERARIAREMHDVISHALSGVIALSDGARYAARATPGTPEPTLATLQTISVQHALSAGQQLAVYRIVQEALTNVLKHAGREARCAVVIVYDEGGLEFSEIDTGRGSASLAAQPDSGAEVSGFYLRGMRERARLHSGQVDARTTPHGFSVTGRFDYDTTTEGA
ncbi:hypothetical protein JT358_04570 [Micrococcales bacterium 31B]|nr:hypothetical protein [Micrococcales bacterium 31B]